ncbi:MAG: hypothetical protein KDK27_11805 [Leptospiraceae bacterium]|nr:hypothetical protein [Leptospiraceae bacterium]
MKWMKMATLIGVALSLVSAAAWFFLMYGQGLVNYRLLVWLFLPALLFFGVMLIVYLKDVAALQTGQRILAIAVLVLNYLFLIVSQPMLLLILLLRNVTNQ